MIAADTCEWVFPCARCLSVCPSACRLAPLSSDSLFLTDSAKSMNRRKPAPLCNGPMDPMEKQRCTHRPPKILKLVQPTRSGGLPCSNFRILNREQGTPQNRTGAHDLCISRWIGRWIGMDRRGACFCEFALAPMTCAFLPMDRRMDRDGSGWIVRSGLL